MIKNFLPVFSCLPDEGKHFERDNRKDAGHDIQKHATEERCEKNAKEATSEGDFIGCLFRRRNLIRGLLIVDFRTSEGKICRFPCRVRI